MLLNTGSVDHPKLCPKLPVEFTRHHGQSCPRDRLSKQHAMWLHSSGSAEIDIDRWTQVKISSGLISVASQSGSLGQAEGRPHHTRLLFREGIPTTGFGLGQAPQRACSRLQSRLAGGITGARAQLRDHHEAIKETRSPPTSPRSFHKDTPFPPRRQEAANWSAGNEKRGWATFWPCFHE